MLVIVFLQLVFMFVCVANLGCEWFVLVGVVPVVVSMRVSVGGWWVHVLVPVLIFE